MLKILWLFDAKRMVIVNKSETSVIGLIVGANTLKYQSGPEKN